MEMDPNQNNENQTENNNNNNNESPSQNPENSENKCSNQEHKDLPAEFYCPQCKIYMCKTCASFHNNMFSSHNPTPIEPSRPEESLEFSGLCPLPKHHYAPFDYYCLSHQELCCSACISKINTIGHGNHKDCEVILLREIENKKKNELPNNINELKNLQKKIEELIDEINKLKIEVNNNKEEVKKEVQRIFEEIRAAVNQRENEILDEIDKKFEKALEITKDKEIVNNEKLPSKITFYIEKGTSTQNDWPKNNLNENIQVCVNIENLIRELKSKYKNIKSNHNINISLKFVSEEKAQELISKIMNFGNLFFNGFFFKDPPLTNNNKKYYEVIGGEKNIVRKTGEEGWGIIPCENFLKKNTVNEWKIKILNTKKEQIMVGVVPSDVDIEKNTHLKYGWYFGIYQSSLYSGPPFNYFGKNTKLKSFFQYRDYSDEITISMDTKNGNLSFSVGKGEEEEKEICYTGIPLNKDLVPAVVLCNAGDTVEISTE